MQGCGDQYGILQFKSDVQSLPQFCFFGIRLHLETIKMTLFRFQLEKSSSIVFCKLLCQGVACGGSPPCTFHAEYFPENNRAGINAGNLHSPRKHRRPKRVLRPVGEVLRLSSLLPDSATDNRGPCRCRKEGSYPCSQEFRRHSSDICPKSPPSKEGDRYIALYEVRHKKLRIKSI